MANFCTNCGAALSAESKFCTGCGTATDAGDIPAAPVQPAPLPSPYHPGSYPVQPRSGPSGLAIGLGIVALLGLGGGVYFLATRGGEDGAVGNGVAAANSAAPAARWASYSDQFLSAEMTLVTTGAANARSYPSINETVISSTFQPGTTVSGRWVKSPDGPRKWLKLTQSGAYVSEVNLSDPAAVAARGPAFNIYQWSGRYPFDPGPNGPSFLSDPAVRAMASAAVPNQRVLSEIDTRQGPQTPIEVQGKRLIAFGCEAHNCGGGFNWSMVVVDSSRGHYMRVCLHDSERMGNWSEWYEGGRVKARIQGECPSNLAGFN